MSSEALSEPLFVATTVAATVQSVPSQLPKRQRRSVPARTPHVVPSAAVQSVQSVLAAHVQGSSHTPPLDFEYYDFAPVAADGAPGAKS